MTELEKIENFKKENNENMARLIAASGGLPPVCTLFVEHQGENKVIVAPVPADALENTKNKERFISIMPKFFKALEEDGNKIICFSYSCEAWLRAVDKDDKIPDNLEDLSKIEVVITSYETADSSVMEVSNIVRNGKIVDRDGELIDCITLEKNEELKDGAELGGRFSNMFTNYLKSKS
jgi:hypothetical protein